MIDAPQLLLDLTVRRQAFCWQLLDSLMSVPTAAARRIVICAASDWPLEGHAGTLNRVNAVWAEPFDPQALLDAYEPLTPATSARKPAALLSGLDFTSVSVD